VSGVGDARPANILVVEDDEGVGDMVQEFLSEAGYLVVRTADAEQALQVLNGSLVDLVFTDVVMPGGMDGFQLAEVIGAKYPGVPVICASGYPQRGEKETASSAGDRCAMFLEKPYRPTRLLDAIERLLAKKAEERKR
jgi:DNA-binding NtrC family response regulator